MKAEFLMLAQVYNPDRHYIAGWFVSEKLDGSRAIWDGGITRGKSIYEIAWANHDRKGHRLNVPVATGLWSRYGNVINAPDWFLDALPPVCLDGELWGGRGSFQTVRSIISQLEPDSRWRGIRFQVFDSPTLGQLLAPRTINTTNYKTTITHNASLDCRQRAFESTIPFLERLLDGNSIAFAHAQVRLPYIDSEAQYVLSTQLDHITNTKGEGLMLRCPHSVWIPQRSWHLLKVKKLQDAEGVVTGFTSGRVTDKGSRLLGKIGALILNYNGQRLELSGLTDDEREFFNNRDWAVAHPGEDMPVGTEGVYFKVGDTITFRYRELSDEGNPKEARYWRKG